MPTSTLLLMRIGMVACCNSQRQQRQQGQQLQLQLQLQQLQKQKQQKRQQGQAQQQVPTITYHPPTDQDDLVAKMRQVRTTLGWPSHDLFPVSVPPLPHLAAAEHQVRCQVISAEARRGEARCGGSVML